MTGLARRADRAGLLALLFFGSGACGLVYQVLWQRRLSLVFGVTTHATSTVLASFMAGLALGSWLAGRVGARARRPLLWFGVVEALVGATALATQPALGLIESLYHDLHPAFAERAWILTALRFALASLVLVVPTTLMGMTLPIVLRSAQAQGGELGPSAARLYGVNTFGAITGALLAGFLAIGWLGIGATFLAAAATNLLIGAAAIRAGRRGEAAAGAEGLGAADPAFGGSARGLVLGVFAVSGLVSLALEVVWFRALAMLVTISTYAFTIMLVAVLAGIATGSRAAGWLMRRGASGLRTLAGLEVAVGLAALGSFSLLQLCYVLFSWMWTKPPSQFDSRYVFLVLLCFAAMFPTAFLLGVAFPIGLRCYAGEGSGPRTAARVGTFCACNVGGAIVGALLAGFALVPGLGCRRSLVLLAGVLLLSGVALALTARPRGLVVAAAALATVAFCIAAPHVPEPVQIAASFRHDGEKVLWHEEGVQGTASVFVLPAGHRVLRIDGLHQADDTAEMSRVHAAIGHAAALLHPGLGAANARRLRALVIGLGGGATAGALARHPGIDVHVVELSPSVVKAASWFEGINHGVLARPNVTVHVADGRNWLAVTRERWDIVTADIIQPHYAGAGNLYSREYFSTVRNALADEGVFVQWAAGRNPVQGNAVMRTFLAAFPEAAYFSFDGVQVLVGGRGPLRLSRAAFERKAADPLERPLLAEARVSGFDDLLRKFVADANGMRHHVGDGPVLSDDRPFVEYYMSLPRRLPSERPPLSGDVRSILGD
jgi:spermidine synthase